MVQVPVTPGRSVQVQPLDTKPFRYARSRNFVGEAVENLGGELRQSAETWDAIEATYDQAEVVDRDNKYAVAVAEKTAEFSNLKGDSPARQMADYTKSLSDLSESLLSNARSERARNISKRNLEVRFQNARLGMQRHSDAEMFKFRDDGLVAGIEIAKKDAVRGYGTENFDLSTATAQLRLNERARLNGWSPEQLAKETADLNAGIRYDAVVALATNGEPTAALAQAEQWEPYFEPEQYSRLNNLLRPRAEAKIARDLAPDIIEQAASATPKGKPPTGGQPGAAGLDAQLKAIESNESGGRQFDRSGKPLTSKAGAIGVMQVMPGTAPEAARLAGLAWDPKRYREDEDYNRALGQAYYKAMLRKFGGDPIKAAAAYNAGPGSAAKGTGVNGAIARARKAGEPENWVAYLPAETRDYVAKFQRKTGAGGVAEQALDPRMDPEFAEAAARKYASANGMSETQTDALVEAARDRASDNMRRRNLVEQEEERQFDQILLDKGIDPDTVTNEADIPPEAWDGLSPSSRLQKREAIARNKERVEKAREGERQAALLQNAVIAGGAIDYSNERVKKAGDTLYATQLSAQGDMDPQKLMSFNVNFATRVGFIPPVLQSQIRAQLNSPNPQLQISAAQTLEEMRVRNPALLGTFSEREVARAEQINEYRRRGVSPKDAADRVAELERMPKSERDGRKSLFAGQAKEAGDATEYLKGEFGVAPSAAMVGEFRAAWEREFVRTGDIDLARATAFATLRRQWGVSYVNGSAQTMKYPPELTYGRLDKGEDDARWIRDQAFKELYGGGISSPWAKERFSLRLWDRTINGMPVYIGTLQQPDGTIVTAVDERGRPKLYQPDFSTSDAYRRIKAERSSMVQRARDLRAGKPVRPRPEANPGFKL